MVEFTENAIIGLTLGFGVFIGLGVCCCVAWSIWCKVSSDDDDARSSKVAPSSGGGTDITDLTGNSQKEMSKVEV